VDNLEQQIKKIGETQIALSKSQEVLQPEYTNQIQAGLHEISQHLRDIKSVIANNRSQFVEFQQSSMNVQQLLQNNLDKLVNVSSQLTTITDISLKQRITTDKQESGEAGEIPPAPPVERTDISDPLDEFINRYQEQIKQASFKGINTIRTLIQQISTTYYSIEFDCPSDQLFILVNRGPRPTVVGKAFVLPGVRLGRPWVEWFDLPKGVYERIELTIEPATVEQEQNGEWRLIKKGKVHQG